MGRAPESSKIRSIRATACFGRANDGTMKTEPEPRTGPFCLPFIRILYAGAEGRVVEMRILLILIVIIAVFVVVQAQRHGCKYDATLINCVLGKSGGEMPAAEA